MRRYLFVFTPQWLAMNIGVLVLASVFGWLGWWQWGRAHRYHRVSPQTIAAFHRPVPANDYLRAGAFVPAQDVGQVVIARGTYDAAHQLTVPGQSLGGHVGCYVVVPLRTGGGDAVIVNRGWIPETRGSCRPSAPPSGTLTVSGWLNQTEAPTDEGPLTSAPDQISEINAAQLVNLWPYRLANGYLTVTAESPSPAAAPARVPSPAHVVETFSWDFQNLAYTAQWWLFGLAGLWWWRQMLIREADRRQYGDDYDDGPYDDDDDLATSQESRRPPGERDQDVMASPATRRS